MAYDIQGFLNVARHRLKYHYEQSLNGDHILQMHDLPKLSYNAIM
jgi:hypothetical protein